MTRVIAEYTDAQRSESYAWLDRLLERWASLSGGLLGEGSQPVLAARTGQLLGRLADEGAEYQRKQRRRPGRPRKHAALAWASTIQGTGKSTPPLPDDVLAVDHAVAALPPKLREIITWHYFRGGPVHVKARDLHCAVSTYYTRMLRAYETLALRLRNGKSG